MTGLVGIIANPASGKDIRRLVAHGSVFDNNEKINIIQRVLLGLDALGVDRALAMPDIAGLARQAAEKAARNYRAALDNRPSVAPKRCGSVAERWPRR